MSRFESNLRQVDTRPALLGRVVAEPQQVVMPNHAGVAAVTAAGQETGLVAKVARNNVQFEFSVNAAQLKGNSDVRPALLTDISDMG